VKLKGDRTFLTTGGGGPSALPILSSVGHEEPPPRFGRKEHTCSQEVHPIKQKNDSDEVKATIVSDNSQISRGGMVCTGKTVSTIPRKARDCPIGLLHENSREKGAFICGVQKHQLLWRFLNPPRTFRWDVNTKKGRTLKIVLPWKKKSDPQIDSQVGPRWGENQR